MSLDVGLNKERYFEDDVVFVDRTICKKGGLCAFSKSCYLYSEGDYHCTFSRGIFLQEGMTHPSCYKKKPNGNGQV